MPKGKPWTTRETSILRKHYGKKTAAELTDLLPERSRSAILIRAGLLGLTNKKAADDKVWTQKERDILKNYYPLHGLKKTAKLLPTRSIRAILQRAYLNRIKIKRS